MVDRSHIVHRGYIHHTDPSLPLERTADKPDWFHIALWSVMIVGTLAVMAFALFSSTSPVLPDALSPVAIEVRDGGKVGS